MSDEENEDYSLPIFRPFTRFAKYYSRTYFTKLPQGRAGQDTGQDTEEENYETKKRGTQKEIH